MQGARNPELTISRYSEEGQGAVADAEDMPEPPLTPARATAEAVAAGKAAGLGRERGKPFTVVSWRYGRVPARTGPECVVTEVTAKRAGDIDDAVMRALLCLPGGVVYSEKGRTVSVWREAATPTPAD
jgi:hypothetical protein